MSDEIMLTRYTHYNRAILISTTRSNLRRPVLIFSSNSLCSLASSLCCSLRSFFPHSLQDDCLRLWLYIGTPWNWRHYMWTPRKRDAVKLTPLYRDAIIYIYIGTPLNLRHDIGTPLYRDAILFGRHSIGAPCIVPFSSVDPVNGHKSGLRPRN